MKPYERPNIEQWPDGDPRRQMDAFDEVALRKQYNDWMPPEQPPLSGLPGLNPMEEILVKEIGEAGGKALDIGCGNGKLLALLAVSGCIERGLGIDISDAMVENASKTVGNIGVEGVELTLVRSSFEELGNKGFDTIIATEVLEHIYNLRSMINKARSILSPDGVFLGTAPDKHTCDAVVHLHYFTTQSLGKLLGDFFRYVHVEKVDATGDGEYHLVFICRNPREVIDE
jgi:2-polyprenyl-3-methyl-5-hydroxy-6-metoxy-1,4-benzoquinol methylase